MDGDGSTGAGLLRVTPGVRTDSASPAFAIGNPPYDMENPFRQGLSSVMDGGKVAVDSLLWIPDIPEDGAYAVYVSYVQGPDRAEMPRYTVRHRGGRPAFWSTRRWAGAHGSTWAGFLRPGRAPRPGRWC
ncbi:MAG: hypothetical protein R2751_11720 [Bacteroidales bacterium]